MVAAQTVYTIRFDLRNSLVPQPSPPVYVSARFEAGRFDSLLPDKYVNATGEDVLGVEGGGKPLYAEYPVFNYTLIEQRKPFRMSKNLLLLYLRPTCDMIPDTNITITGLTLTLTPSSSALPINRSTDDAIAPTATWNQTTGALVLRVKSALRHRKLYTIQFFLVNPVRTQDFPRHLVLNGVIPDAYEVLIHPQVVDQSTATIYGFEAGMQPFNVLELQALRTRAWQLSPFPGVENTLFYRMYFNLDLLEGTEVRHLCVCLSFYL
jgi:hypothetical protein